MNQALRHAFYSAILNTEATATFMFLPVWGQHMVINPHSKLITAYPHLCCELGIIAPLLQRSRILPQPGNTSFSGRLEPTNYCSLEHSCKERKEKKNFVGRVTLPASIKEKETRIHLKNHNPTWLRGLALAAPEVNWKLR
eukprot:813669-Pelagomonas_calceolata.AAC.1